MKTFYLHFETMPKGTAQQKRYNRKTGVFFKDKKMLNAETEFRTALLPYRPKEPTDKPVKLSLYFYFDVKDRSKWKKPKTSRPDAENYAKAFIDQMTTCGFWKDDSQIVDLKIQKYYAEKATIVVAWEEVPT